MFQGKPTNIQGFEIPFDGRLFLTVLGIHVLFGIACVVAGLVAMLSRKWHGRHSNAGIVYYWALWGLFGTAALMVAARWVEDYHLLILGGISFASALVARRSVRLKWKHWPLFHITGMGTSYIFLLIAFYVDNGKFLPVWKSLPHIVYWLLPLLVGMPILIRALLMSPYSRKYFSKQES